jgi:O-succinylbenzoic acid--CoA ligase
MVVEGWLARAAATRPEHTALDTPLGSWSYRELLAAARLGAGELARRGARAEQRVAIALPPGLAFAQALHACLLLGAVAVPVDLRLSSAEQARIADGATVLVEAPLPGGGPGATWPGGGPGGTTWLGRPTGPSPGTRAGECLAAAGQGSTGPGPGTRAGDLAAAGHDLDAVAVVIHTSGTTSSPKAVELTYGNILWSALGSAVALGLDARERWLCVLPVSHVGGLSILLRSAVYATTAVVHERFDAEHVLHALREQQITLVSLVATTLGRLLDAGLTRPPTLRCALTGGGPVPEGLLERARGAGVPVSLTYGLTEAGSQVTTTPVGALADGGGGSRAACPPLFCTRLRIAPDQEILLRGPTVARCGISADRWLHTGDLGCLDEDGWLHVSGRKADTIVSGGENVAPAEVEAVLEAHPHVLEAAVLGRPDPQWGEVVAAIVVARPGVALESEALRAHCAARLAPYKIPKRVDLVSGPLPRTRSGKLRRRELR